MTTKVRKSKCCKESKEKTRKELISAALAKAYYFSDEERRESIKIYEKDNLSIEEILRITEPLREMQNDITKHKNNFHKGRQISRMGVYKVD